MKLYFKMGAVLFHILVSSRKERCFLNDKKEVSSRSKGRSRLAAAIWLGIAAVFLVLSLIVGQPHGSGGEESLKDAMRDAVLHEDNRVSLFGIMEVNPAVISALTVSAVILIAAALIRILAIPRFKRIPGRLQLVLETLVGLFDGIAVKNSPHKNKLLGGYIFGAGCYIFIGTIFELFGFQVITTSGHSMSMPAPLSDINAAIAMGFLSYFLILLGGISSNGAKGAANTLKDFSLPVSMSFRLFGALLSGLLVTELVYHSLALSYLIPVAVGVLFTLLHAVIQAYVLVMLTALFYGEVSEPHEKKSRKEKRSKKSAGENAAAAKTAEERKA